MLRLLILTYLLTGCSLGVLRSGGEKTYLYDVASQYHSEDLKALAPAVVTTLKREPPLGKLEDLFSNKQAPLKRIGFVVFETTIQPTRSGLANGDLIYMSATGKQLLTEKLLKIWEESLPILASEIDFVPTSKVKANKAFQKYGATVKDYILTRHSTLAPDDIFYLPSGKETTMVTVLNPRGMRDLSLALVPAGELMMGPKFSEHHKHAVNELAKELRLDAVVIVMSHLSWSAARVDKHSGELISEEAKLKIEASTLIPFGQYHERLTKAGNNGEYPKTTIAYRTYEAKLSIPVLISISPDDQSFESIERELLAPMMKTYNDLTQMVIGTLAQDLKETH